MPIQRLPCRLRAPSLPSSAFLLSFAIRFKSGNGAANDRASGPCSRSLPLPSLFLLSRPLDRSVDSWVLAMRVGHRDRRRTERHPSLFVHTRGKGSLSALRLQYIAQPLGRWCVMANGSNTVTETVTQISLFGALI